MYKTFLILIIILLFNIFICNDENSKEEMVSCEKEQENIQNTFLLKTNLSESEIEDLLLQEFSSLSKNKKKNPRRKAINEDDVKHFKSKNNQNKTISLLEIKNISEFQTEKEDNNKEKIPYQLIDVKETDETKIFLSFDKFFKSQYKEMFEYSYTIVIFFFALIGMIIYYTCFLPTEANELNRTSRNNKPILDNISNDDNINNENDADVDYILKE